MDTPDPPLYTLDRSVDDVNEAALQLDDFPSFHFLAKDTPGSLDAFYADMGIDPLASISPDHKYNFEIPAESIENGSSAQDEVQQQADGTTAHFSPAENLAEGNHTAVHNDASGPLPNGMKFESTDPPLFTASPQQSPQPTQKSPTPSTTQQGMSSCSHFQPICHYGVSTPSSFQQSPTPHGVAFLAQPPFHNPFTTDRLPVNNRISHLAHSIPQIGRRRSQSMPPPEFSFHRRLESGDVLAIGHPVHQQHVTAHDVPHLHPYGNAVARFRGPYGEGMGFENPWSYPASPVPEMYGHCHPADIATAPSSPAGTAVVCDEFGAQAQGPRSNNGVRAGHKRGVSASPARHEDPDRRKVRGKKTSGQGGRRGGQGRAGPDPRAYAENVLGLDGMERVGLEGMPKVEMPQGNALDMVRHSQRSTNIRIEDIDQPMEVLAGCAKSLVHVPRTGRAIRELDGEAIESLLQAYGLQYAPEMFVFEKKFMYLRFIGINRELMHRILD